MKVFMLVGECGTGKTWVMQEIIKQFKLDTLGKVGMFYFHRSDRLICLGKYDGSVFQGSDKLSMAVMGDIKEFKKYVTKNNYVVVCEGDRFMNETFTEAFKGSLEVTAITNDGAKGRKKRKSTQTERHLKAIRTRVSKFIKMSRHQCIDSTIALQLLKEDIKSAL